MKITARQLKRIIKEETRRSFQRRINESGTFGESPLTSVTDLIENLGSEVEESISDLKEEWNDRYEEEDPSMSQMGRRAWEDQVSAACDDLESMIMDIIDESDLSEKIRSAYDEIEDNLIGGQYFR